MTRQIKAAVAKFGAGSILVASFTRGAARVLVEKDLPIPESAIGTLHAHCYRALGRPRLAEAYLKEFGEASNLLISGASISRSLEESTDMPAGKTQDDQSYMDYSKLRNRLVPREVWPDSVKLFAKHWEAFKHEHDMMDFTDLIEVASRDMLYAPGNAQVAFFDEAQDSTPLQHKLMERWGKSMRFYIKAGDDDQCLYGFLGATPETMMGVGLPEDKKLFLRQSWRVPGAVQEYAEKIIGHVGRRQPKEYRPREERGEVHVRIPVRWKNPTPLVSLIEKDLGDGESVMVLAPCSYAVLPLIKELKRLAIPFGNPFRVTRADWNPLVLTSKRESALSRVRDFLEPELELRYTEDTAPSRLWSPRQLLAWTKLVDRDEWFGRGFKAQLERMEKNKERSPAMILDTLFQYARSAGYLSDIITLLSTGQQKKALAILRLNFCPGKEVAIGSADYALRCVERAGGDTESIKPRLCVGTIHSVKGGQADSVYVIPDVPAAVYQSTMVSREEYDASVRLAYVAVTRAKHKVSVLAPETRFTMRGIFG